MPGFNRCHLDTREGVERHWGKGFGSEILPLTLQCPSLFFIRLGTAFRVIVSVVPYPTILAQRLQCPDGLAEDLKKCMVSYPFHLISNVSMLLSWASGCLPRVKSCPHLLTPRECLLHSSGWLGPGPSGRRAVPSS